MELYTRILLPKARFSFSYEDRVVMVGSCFAENIGRKLEENKFAVDVNPFGTLYNPASVAEGLRRLLRPERFTPGDLFRHEGVYHSFAHHSRFSAPSEEECLEQINSRLSQSADFLRKATRLVITWGTAFVYRLKSDGRIVSNCHKLPEKQFDRRRLSVREIVAEWEALLQALWEQRPALKILFTVSPIRHWKDGAHENQLSKATLLLAADALRKEAPDRIDYFPAYEILMDELRDYRFYADDMLHPSPLAIDFIWQRFTGNFLSAETLAILKEWGDIQKAIHHKPFQPGSEAYKRFMLQTLLKMERISGKMPSFDLGKEIEIVKSKLE
ncbi:GSCFA domain-containing protein [Parabacteroides sp. ZJ-118]|uniref:GSCFA domain-containing protein n=1 Tax=Parabacteroides sp. ZJ-118 TaxID=2709398 RepID=UPI0013EE276E|nr:GSCFA domain-containing protein [Parabacteroides sp. ZJ-118]